MKTIKMLLQIYRELKHFKRVNVVYIDTENGDDIIFVDRQFMSDVPKTGAAVIRSGKYWRVNTVWHNLDDNTIEVDLENL